MSKSIMSMVAVVGMGGWLTIATTTQANAVEKRLAEFDYLRLQASVSAAAAPDVEEDTSPVGGGGNTHYEWNETRDTGIQAAFTCLVGKGISNETSWQWGAEFVFGNYNITPHTFTTSGTGGGFNKNGSTSNLYHRTYGINLVGGWQWGMTNLDEWTGFIEVMPHIGGGIATADNEVYDGTSYTKQTGSGAYYEVGLRVGGYITEKRFIYGVNIHYQYGLSKVDVDFPGYTSEMELKRYGLGIGAVAGYRF